MKSRREVQAKLQKLPIKMMKMIKPVTMKLMMKKKMRRRKKMKRQREKERIINSAKEY